MSQIPKCGICRFYNKPSNVCTNQVNVQPHPIAEGTVMALVPPSPDWFCNLFEEVQLPVIEQLVKLLEIQVEIDTQGTEWLHLPWGRVQKDTFKPEVNAQNTMELLGWFKSLTKRSVAIAPAEEIGRWKVWDEDTNMEKVVWGRNLSAEVTSYLLEELRKAKR